ncbi:carbon-nitrogen hydrolase family protein, partial [Pseudomonas syringae]|nr:carbon-nitrogen hydrolase family protein [Pseudomonas syringae]
GEGEGAGVGGMQGEGGGLVVAPRQREGWRVRAVTVD